jgi:hypothetical protein
MSTEWMIQLRLLFCAVTEPDINRGNFQPAFYNNLHFIAIVWFITVLLARMQISASFDKMSQLKMLMIDVN